MLSRWLGGVLVQPMIGDTGRIVRLEQPPHRHPPQLPWEHYWNTTDMECDTITMAEYAATRKSRNPAALGGLCTTDNPKKCKREEGATTRDFASCFSCEDKEQVPVCGSLPPSTQAQAAQLRAVLASMGADELLLTTDLDDQALLRADLRDKKFPRWGQDSVPQELVGGGGDRFGTSMWATAGSEACNKLAACRDAPRSSWNFAWPLLPTWGGLARAHRFLTATSESAGGGGKVVALHWRVERMRVSDAKNCARAAERASDAAAKGGTHGRVLMTDASHPRAHSRAPWSSGGSHSHPSVGGALTFLTDDKGWEMYDLWLGNATDADGGPQSEKAVAGHHEMFLAEQQVAIDASVFVYCIDPSALCWRCSEGRRSAASILERRELLKTGPSVAWPDAAFEGLEGSWTHMKSVRDWELLERSESALRSGLASSLKPILAKLKRHEKDVPDGGDLGLSVRTANIAAMEKRLLELGEKG